MVPQPPFPPEPSELRDTLFPQSSRYYGLDVLRIILPNGREVAYVERRFLPPHEILEVVEEHRVISGDRIDNIAVSDSGDPELFWRVCDGNYELDPSKLPSDSTRKILITLPAPISGNIDG